MKLIEVVAFPVQIEEWYEDKVDIKVALFDSRAGRYRETIPETADAMFYLDIVHRKQLSCKYSALLFKAFKL